MKQTFHPIGYPFSSVIVCNAACTFIIAIYPKCTFRKLSFRKSQNSRFCRNAPVIGY